MCLLDGFIFTVYVGRHHPAGNKVLNWYPFDYMKNKSRLFDGCVCVYAMH